MERRHRKLVKGVRIDDVEGILVDCYRCGKRIAEDSLYCKFCGARQGKTVTDEFTVEAGDLLKRI